MADELVASCTPAAELRFFPGAALDLSRLPSRAPPGHWTPTMQNGTAWADRSCEAAARCYGCPPSALARRRSQRPGLRRHQDHLPGRAASGRDIGSEHLLPGAPGAHPLAGKRVADLPLADGRRLYEALRGGRFLLAASPGALPADAASGYGDRVDAALAARACGTVALIRPDAYIAWAAAGNAAIAPQIRGCLARWCRSPADRQYGPSTSLMR